MINKLRQLKNEKERAQTEKETQRKSKLEQQSYKRKEKIKDQSQTRVNDWLVDINDNDKMFKTLYHGNSIASHETYYDFRQTDKTKMIHDKDVYVRTQMSSKFRADQQEQMNKENLLENDLYVTDNTERQFILSLRERQDNIEGPPLRYGYRTENEKLKNNLQEIKILDLEYRNTKMIHYPEWKEPMKERWLDNNLRATFTESDKWKQTAIRYQKDLDLYKYEDGIIKIGEEVISRKRQKDKEMKRSDFISTICKDVWETRLNHSKSIRTNKQDQIYGAKVKEQFYSTNKQLQFYKKAIVDSKSIDNEQPFIHSQNIRNATLKDVRPNQPKIYKNTVKDQIINHNVKHQQFSDPTTFDNLQDLTNTNSNNKFPQKGDFIKEKPTQIILNPNLKKERQQLPETEETNQEDEHSYIDEKYKQKILKQQQQTIIKKDSMQNLTRQQKIISIVSKYFKS